MNVVKMMNMTNLDYNEKHDNSINECFAQKGEEWGKSEHYVRRSRQPHAFCQVAPGLHT